MTYPTTAKRIAELIGESSMLDLAGACSNRIIYIPKNKKMLPWLESIVGKKNASKLYDEYAGQNVYLANCNSIFVAGRNRRIRKEFKAGVTIPELAQRYDVSIRSIRAITQGIPRPTTPPVIGTSDTPRMVGPTE